MGVTARGHSRDNAQSCHGHVMALTRRCQPLSPMSRGVVPGPAEPMKYRQTERLRSGYDDAGERARRPPGASARRRPERRRDDERHPRAAWCPRRGDSLASGAGAGEAGTGGAGPGRLVQLWWLRASQRGALRHQGGAVPAVLGGAPRAGRPEGPPGRLGSIRPPARCRSVAAAFPRGRVLRRSWVRTGDQLSRFGGAALVALAFAFVGAFFVSPAESTWIGRFVLGLGIAVLALCLVVALVVVFNLCPWPCQSPRWWPGKVLAVVSR